MAEPATRPEPSGDDDWTDEALRILARAGRVLGAELDQPATLSALVRFLVPELADVAVVFLVVPAGHIVPVEVCHRDREQELAVRELFARYPPAFTRPGSVIARVVERGDALLLPEVNDALLGAAAEDDEHLALLRGLDFRSAIVAPLVSRGRSLGALAFALTSGDRMYGPADLMLAKELAFRAALAVDNCRLHLAECEARREAERTTVQARQLYVVSELLAQTRSPEEIGGVVVPATMETLGAGAGFMALLADDGRTIEFIHRRGEPASAAYAGRSIALDAPVPLADVVRSGAPIYLEPRPGDAAMALLPLRAGDHPAGGLGFSFAGDRLFPPDERRFLATIARQCSQALERVRLDVTLSAATARSREALAQLNGLLVNAPIGVGFVDRDLRFVRVNPMLAMTDDVPAEAHVGRAIDEVLPRLGSRLAALCRRVLSGGTPIVEQVVHGGAAGQRVTWLVSAYPVQGQRGDVAWVGLLVRDVTERAHDEERQRKAQRMEALGRLAGGMAHEVNNMMTVILGFTELLLEAPDIAEPHAADLREIRGAANRAASVARQLLAFSRRQLMAAEPLDLNRIVSSAVPALQELLGDQVELELLLEPGLGPVRSDRTQLHQVLTILALNAREAMAGEGRVTITTRSVHIEADELRARIGIAVPAGRYAMLVVRDSGIGMDPITETRAFEPFFTTKPLSEHSGLGLATVYGIVKQTRGFIWVESEPYRGAAFTIILPEEVLEEAHGSRP